jgi:hypothetical protein
MTAEQAGNQKNLEELMTRRGKVEALAMAALLMLAAGDALAQGKQYPNWKGEWATARK